MSRNSFLSDRRGVSPAVTQALTIGITSLLVTGLLIGGSQMVDSQRERVTEEALENVGDGIARDLIRLDAFNTESLNSSVSFRATYPERIADQSYNVEVSPDTSRTRLYVNASGLNRYAVVRFENETNVCSSVVSSGPLAVSYNATADCLEVSG
ncbi:hypothetical protein Harman_27150 [Haloarcula mannanilytica]|uniref:Uncharacterized protein n=1 Tax=Haloarcula mannanilytica TaxID=2509225 RepID=A0A4C2EN18_9EURY|nr:hypothetical protein [Haloarcula mannanilytica]GCF14780.1 hypothetical protein Harman_27150 [Haloarcula mannanilytica]